MNKYTSLLPCYMFQCYCQKAAKAKWKFQKLAIDRKNPSDSNSDSIHSFVHVPLTNVPVKHASQLVMKNRCDQGSPVFFY